jgi:hypothetical protein
MKSKCVTVEAEFSLIPKTMPKKLTDKNAELL